MFKICLDLAGADRHDLNMVKIDPSTDKGEQTRRHIFECALELFREKGFDSTTIQEISNRAEVVKSAAYYYFPSKEAIIQAYYETVQAEQERLCGNEFAKNKSLKTRLKLAMHSKFDLTKDDRKLLGVVFRYTGEPEHPLSCLGVGRRRSVAAVHRFSEKPLLRRSCRRIYKSCCRLLCGRSRWAFW